MWCFAGSQGLLGLQGGGGGKGQAQLKRLRG